MNIKGVTKCLSHTLYGDDDQFANNMPDKAVRVFRKF